jgi:hypothetical protein
VSEHGEIEAAEARIRRVLAAKNVGAADYWRTRGRVRFARELAQDGVPEGEAHELLATIEHEFFHAGDVDLDEVLRGLVDRLTDRPRT